jgi:hypothetical protein
VYDVVKAKICWSERKRVEVEADVEFDVSFEEELRGE